MLERTLANAAYSSRGVEGASAGGGDAHAHLDGEVITRELGTIRSDGPKRYAGQRVSGGEAQEQWVHKWGTLLDDAMRKITGAGPVASTLQVGLQFALLVHIFSSDLYFVPLINARSLSRNPRLQSKPTLIEPGSRIWKPHFPSSRTLRS